MGGEGFLDERIDGEGIGEGRRSEKAEGKEGRFHGALIEMGCRDACVPGTCGDGSACGRPGVIEAVPQQSMTVFPAFNSRPGDHLGASVPCLSSTSGAFTGKLI